MKGVCLVWSRPDLSSLTVFRTISRSHDKAQKPHGKKIHKPMEYTFLEYFYFCLVKLLFGANAVEKHSSKAYLSYLIDWLTRHGPHNYSISRQMPNEVIVTSLSHLDTFCPLCQNGGKR